MRILLTGANGQVGWELRRTLASQGALAAFTRAELDLARPDQIRERVREVAPDVIVNAGAYTAVDRAESESDLAVAINATAPGVLAEEAKRSGALLVHYSTDYVFDGTNRAPYTEDDAPRPLSVYGRSKLEGEQAIGSSGCRHAVLRTSWVYSSRGKNFLLTVLRLARERQEVRVVDDQRGAPTWARHIAEATADVLRSMPPPGLYHLAASGATTWCGFAREIVRLANLPTRVTPITSAEYPAAAVRPQSSVLSTDKLAHAAKIALPDWPIGLRACMATLTESDRRRDGEASNI